MLDAWSISSSRTPGSFGAGCTQRSLALRSERTCLPVRVQRQEALAVRSNGSQITVSERLMGFILISISNCHFLARWGCIL
ncbi:unnamed protein product [Fusarium venenatum]|uniref:Uncharacterized protein n=1 Tax=Fusarium venenatum TaxID=56646 RepID=A0A2L2SQB6_9HYPO|nr:uncharacterized protein FVRRES_12927 [Fusarium venenatum]CEI40236.1 unnamed protein product [Fusarium venenatum]